MLKLKENSIINTVIVTSMPTELYAAMLAFFIEKPPVDAAVPVFPLLQEQ